MVELAFLQRMLHAFVDGGKHLVAVVAVELDQVVDAVQPSVEVGDIIHLLDFAPEVLV